MRRIQVLEADPLTAAGRQCVACAPRARSAICRAVRSSSTTSTLSPAPGTDVKPMTWTGRDGAPRPCRRRARRPCDARGRRRRRRRSSRRRAACRAGWSTVATGPRPGRGAPRSRHPGRPGRDWPAGPATSAVSSTASSRASMLVPWLGGDVDEHRVAAVLLGDQARTRSAAADLARVRALLVDLVDRNHDRHVSGLRVVHRLDRLRHDTVIGRDHEDRDVGGLRRGHAWR